MKNHSIFSFSEPELIEEIEKNGKTHQFSTGEVIVQPEKYIKVIPLLISGTVKVLRADENGNELFLYHISTGESCAVSLASSLAEKQSYIKAIAEEETELMAIPAHLAIDWFRKYPSWQLFVLATMNNRFDELIRTIDNVAFNHIDKRLVNFLLAKSNALKTKEILITHQEIANELATSREIISRLLKKLEGSGKIRLLRNKIEIIALV